MSKETTTIRDKEVDICFVIDATAHTQSVLRGMIEHANDLSNELQTRNRQANIKYGAVIYRDPVDYRELPSDSIPSDVQAQIKEIEERKKQERIHRLKEAGVYDEEYEKRKEEEVHNFDREKYPINKNVSIEFKSNIESLIDEIKKVESNGGNDDPEDWAGALKCALNELEWGEGSERCIVWIADANAHGRRYCGYDNHNEEERKLQPSIEEAAEKRIHFIGINVTKGIDDGCKRTLEEIRDIYSSAQGPSFIYEEFKPVFNADLFDDDNWPKDVIEQFMQTIKNALFNLGDDFF